MTDKKRWMLTHDSHKLKKGEIYEGDELPAWLAGKAIPATAPTVPHDSVSQEVFDEMKATNDALTAEVATLKTQLADVQAALDKANADLQAKAKKG